VPVFVVGSGTKSTRQPCRSCASRSICIRPATLKYSVTTSNRRSSTR
jgi:hypothetical protein